MSIKKIYLLCLLFIVTIALLITSHWLPIAVNLFVSIPLMIFLPGLLIWVRFYQHKHTELTKLFLFSAALGIVIIFAEGLALNWLLPVIFRVNQPLQQASIITTYALSCIGLGLTFAGKRGREIASTRVTLTPNPYHLWRFLLPLLLPLMAAAGAFRLNNGANNIVTIILFCLIGLGIIIYLLRPKLINAEWFLFNSALALLLSTSLRSWYLTGFDVSQEFQVFSLAVQHHFWDLRALPGDAYNACLSITLLPAFLQQATGIAGEYLFRFTFQAILSLSAVIVFLIARQYAPKRLAFLAAVFYITQTQFIGAMYAIGRQEISLVFFGLMLLLLVSKQQLTRNHKTLLIIMAIGMVLSHYSTSYIAIGLVAVATVVGLIMHWLGRHKHIRFDQVAFSPGMGAKLVIYLVLLSSLWYSQINLSSGNLTSVVGSSLTSLSQTFTTVEQTLHLLPSLSKTMPTNNHAVAHYQQDTKLKTNLSIPPSQVLPVKNDQLVQATAVSRIIFVLFVEVLLPLSPFILLCIPRYRQHMYGILPLCIGSVAVISLLIVMPFLSYDYNLARAYQQALMLLTVPATLLLFNLFPIRKQYLRYGFVSIFFILYFLTSPGSGLINQLVGGIDPPLNLSNSGTTYQEYYTHASEVLAAQWFGNNCTDSGMYADRYASLRLTAYGNIPFDAISPDILTANSNACIYLDYTNTISATFYGYSHKQTIPFTSKQDLFSKTNNLIYSNGQSSVYAH